MMNSVENAFASSSTDVSGTGFLSAPILTSSSSSPDRNRRGGSNSFFQPQQQQQHQQPSAFFDSYGNGERRGGMTTAYDRFIRKKMGNFDSQQQQQQSSSMSAQKQNIIARSEERGRAYLNTFYQCDNLGRRYKKMKERLEEELQKAWEAMREAMQESGKEYLDLPDGSQIVTHVEKAQKEKASFTKTFARLLDERIISVNDVTFQRDLLSVWLEDQMAIDCDYKGDILHPTISAKHNKLKPKEMEAYRRSIGMGENNEEEMDTE